MAELREIGWPIHLQNIKELMELDRVSDIQMLKLAQAIEDMEDDILISTATEKGIARREKILGITPLDTDTLEDRRLRVMSKWYDIYPYTQLDLARRLDLLCGSGQYVMSLDPNTMTLTVLLELTAKSQFQSVSDLLEKIVPVWIILDIRLRYNQWKKVKQKKTWNWAKARTWRQILEEVITDD